MYLYSLYIRLSPSLWLTNKRLRCKCLLNDDCSVANFKLTRMYKLSTMVSTEWLGLHNHFILAQAWPTAAKVGALHYFSIWLQHLQYCYKWDVSLSIMPVRLLYCSFAGKSPAKIVWLFSLLQFITCVNVKNNYLERYLKWRDITRDFTVMLRIIANNCACLMIYQSKNAS